MVSPVSCAALAKMQVTFRFRKRTRNHSPPRPPRPKIPYVEYVYEVAANTIVAGEADSVRSFLEKLLGGDPRHAQLLWRLADFASRQHNHQAALQIYQHAAMLAPENRELHMGIANAYEDMGDVEAARAVWSSAALRGVVRIHAYTGTGEPLRLLTIASAVHAIRYELLVDSSQILNTVLYTQTYNDQDPLPEHDAIFVAIGDVEADSAALEAAKHIIARTAGAVLNHPDQIARTGRREQAQRLRLIEGVRTSHIVSVSRHQLCVPDAAEFVHELGFEFPLLLRSPGFHNGHFFEPVDRPDQLAPVASRLPGEDVLLMSFEDTRSPDGMMRKYRMMCIDGVLYPIHLAISADWKVHYSSSLMRDSAAFRAEEAAYLCNPVTAIGSRAMQALESIAMVTALDYGGIDFGIDATGNVVVFEANTAMGIFMPDDDPRWDYRRERVLSRPRCRQEHDRPPALLRIVDRYADLALVAVQKCTRRGVMVDHRRRIGIAAEQRKCQLRTARFEVRLEERAVATGTQFRYPAPNESSARIAATALRTRIVNARIGCQIGAHAGNPLPISGRERGLVLDQPVIPFVAADPPIDAQIEAQKRCSYRAHARMHPTRRAQLPHAGVDQRKAGLSGPPCVQRRMRAREAESAHLVLQRRIVKGLIEVPKLQEEIALRERTKKQVDRDSFFGQQQAVGAAIAHRGNDTARRDDAKREWCGQLRGLTVCRHVARDCVMQYLVLEITVETPANLFGIDRLVEIGAAPELS